MRKNPPVSTKQLGSALNKGKLTTYYGLPFADGLPQMDMRHFESNRGRNSDQYRDTVALL